MQLTNIYNPTLSALIMPCHSNTYSKQIINLISVFNSCAAKCSDIAGCVHHMYCLHL